MDKHTIGNQGEEIAAAYLKTHHFRILARNWRKRFGEIDIIAEKQGVTYFVEVKSAQDWQYARPGDKVNARKKKQIAKAALAWFMELGKETMSTLLVAEVNLQTREVYLTEEFLLS